MHKEVLRAIAGIETFPVVSMVLFLVAFTLVVIWAIRMDRESAARLAALPLDGPALPGTEPPTDIEGGPRGA